MNVNAPRKRARLNITHLIMGTVLREARRGGDLYVVIFNWWHAEREREREDIDKRLSRQKGTAWL